MKIQAILLAATTGFTTGCYTPGFDSPDPEMRRVAIVQAANSNNPADYPRLVQQLDDDDPDARMLAILVLEQRTGTNRGYDFAAPRALREPSLKEWQVWAEQFASQTRQAPGSDSPARPTPARESGG